MLILPDWLIVAADQPPLAGYGVRTAGGLVTDIAPNAELITSYPDDLLVDAEGHAVLPGFVNAHTHTYGTLAHGIPAPAGGGPTDFWSFLADYWWPLVEDALDVDMITAATNWACVEMLRSGTTSFYDIVEAPNALPGVLSAQREIVEARGLRARLSFEATERAGAEVAKRSLAENVEFIDSCTRETDGPGRLPKVDGLMCWHTTFTCSTDFIAEAFALAAERGVLSHAHCNEGTFEGQWAEDNLGMRPVEIYDSLGIAGPQFQASQCVQLTEGERRLLTERGVRITHMPLANGEVGGGIAPIPELAAAGATIGLGSDGYINDLYEVMRGAFLIHKARLRDPQTMPAAQVLGMATEGGAKALGMEKVGRLELGWAADVQVVDARFPTPVTEHNLIEQLVLWRNGSHVRDVLVAGRWRVRNHEVLDADIDELQATTREQATRLWARS
ncbi:MAG: amidohydrolase family protein [Actinomycetota bacterium]